MSAADADPQKWAQLRAEFHLPPGQIYLDGNSLGLLNRRSEAAVLQVLAAWATQGIGGWSDAGWIDLAERTAAQLAPLIGASASAVALRSSSPQRARRCAPPCAAPRTPATS